MKFGTELKTVTEEFDKNITSPIIVGETMAKYGIAGVAVVRVTQDTFEPSDEYPDGRTVLTIHYYEQLTEEQSGSEAQPGV